MDGPMADDFQQLEFHKLKIPDVDLKPGSFKFNILEGSLCLVCKVKCSGLTKHPWRPGCNTCKCALWCHDIPQDAAGHPFHRLNVDEELPPLISEYDKALTEGFSWVPRGLRMSQIDFFMRYFPKEQAPKVNTAGAKYRTRQLICQLPEYDFHYKSTNFLKDEAIHSFRDVCQKRITEAIGVGAVRGALSLPVKCTGCSESITPGQMAVFSDRLGSDHCWHPQCFKCCEDDTALVDLIHFVHDKKLYCGRHWSEQIKPRCHGCDELIYIGEYTKAMDKAWHVEHFCCWQCDLPLTGKKYIIINELPYCEICYNMRLANTCHACTEPIGPESKDLYVKNRHYHKECLLCSHCKKPLESQTFSFINDQPVCHKCRGVDPEKSQHCHSCDEEFLAEEKKVGVGDEYYHEKCFICSACTKEIGSQKFIRKNDGRRLCSDCFEQSAKTCSKCNDTIKGSTVKFEGNAFHTECFVCSNCKRQLGGVQFYKKEDDPFCEDCYLATHAKRCAACYEPVEGNTKFIDYDRKYWHSKCFVCAKCEKLLAGAKFVIKNGSRYCLDCK